jgi:stage II sporulation protein D
MIKNPIQNFKYLLAAALAFLFLGGVPVEFAEENTFFHGYLIPKPIIRIGLGVNLSQIQIASSAGMKIYEVKENYTLVADDVEEAFIKGQKEKLSEIFLIRVRQTRDIEEAELLAQDLRNKLVNKVYVRRNTEDRIGGLYQVMVGDFLTRGDALRYIMTLNAIGIKDTWIIQEEITEKESRPLWILINEELKSLSNDTVLYFIPSNPLSYLTFKGRDYRGIFVLRASRRGIVLVNILNFEDYLKSVVPSELSPYTFNELEAQKAQAVAARTYAAKNLNKYDEFGYDMCDTPKSQFYKGMSAEHPLSSLAVMDTKGEAALYRGKLIDALYTSTCGGMTENVEDVFYGYALPYLRSTECVYEKQREFVLESESSVAPVYVNGNNASREIVSLLSLKVIPRELDPAYYGEEAVFAEVLAWIQNALPILGKKARNYTAEQTVINYRSFANLIFDAFEWQELVENLLLKSEENFILKDSAEFNGKESGRVAYLIQEGVFPAQSEAGALDRVLTRGEAALFLWKAIQDHPALIHHGLFKGLQNGKILLEEKKEVKEFSLSPDFFLARNYDGDFSFQKQVYFLGGEEVRWIEKDGIIWMLEVSYPRHSNILDRSSSLHSWKVRKSNDELEKRINQYYPIGELKDIIPQRRGNSKRVVELKIVGEKTQAVVKGLRIRRVLGLRETLFVIDREFVDTDKISHFTFTGKGWGHGVGLCQIGAFGMAQAGANYQEILKKYYKDIKISKVY